MISRVQPNNFLHTLFGFQKTKNKAHILLTVLIHAAGWCLLFLLPVLLYPVRINNGFITRELIDKAVLVILFYLNYYWLIPRFFEKKKYAIYFSLVFLAFMLYFSLHVNLRLFYFRGEGGPSIQMVRSGAINAEKGGSAFVVNNSVQGFGVHVIRDSAGFVTSFEGPASSTDSLIRTAGRPPFPEPFLFGIPRGAWLMTLNNAISSFTLLLLIGGFIRLSYSFIRNQNEKKALENANLNAEVNFLKSQINPHFLFNTLNSIYSQAHSRSVNTEHSILKLSELLRYVLYESGDNQVELSKDIQYINNYIDLQRLRLSQKIKINYSVTGNMQGKKIAPLLLITFIENAFKHGISYSLASCIDISIVIFEKTLTLSVVNPILEKDSFETGGLGLKNVRRRLELLYPGHQLDVFCNESLYIINLKIDLANA